MTVNKYLDVETKGLDSFVDYDGASTNAERIAAFRNLIAQEHTQEHRGHLDQISPAAHRQLIVEIDSLADVIEPDGVSDTEAIVTDSDSLTITDMGSGTASATASVSSSTIDSIVLAGTSAIVSNGDTLTTEAGTVTLTITDGVITASYTAD